MNSVLVLQGSQLQTSSVQSFPIRQSSHDAVRLKAGITLVGFLLSLSLSLSLCMRVSVCACVCVSVCVCARTRIRKRESVCVC